MAILVFLKKLHDQLLPLVVSLRFDKHSPLHFHQVALYGTLLELTHGILVLIDKDARVGVPSLFRSILEASVELRNLQRDASYIENMSAAYVKQWLALLKEAKKGTNPYLAELASLPNIDSHIAEADSKLQTLMEKGKKPLIIFERFERAGMLDEYRSMYNDLSCDAHSNTRALISRHVEFSSDDFAVVYYKDEPVDTLIAELDSTAGLLIEASLSVHVAFQSDVIKQVHALHDELCAIRASYVT